MKATWVTITRAAQLLGISAKTLIRAERAGRIRFSRGRRGRRIIQRYYLFGANVLTLGRAARMLGVHYETLLRAAKTGRLKATPPCRLVGVEVQPCFRHTSWREARWWAISAGLWPKKPQGSGTRTPPQGHAK